MRSLMWMPVLTMAIAPWAWGGYILETSSGGQHTVSVAPGQQFTVNIVLTRDTTDVQTNEAIDSFEFAVEVSQPGVQYLSYSLPAPFVTGGTDDYSEPKSGVAPFPMEITTGLDAGWGTVAGARDVYLSAFNPGVETFSEGIIATLQLRAPMSGTGFTVQAYSTGEYSFVGPDVYPATQGQQLYVAVPEPGTCLLGGIVMLSALTLRKRPLTA